MVGILRLSAARAVLLTTIASAQQFSDWKWAVDYPGISSACAQALNTTVSCDPVLSFLAQQEGALINSTKLDVLCTSTCQSSLSSARGTINNACTASTDVLLLYDNDIAYPATYIVDNLIYAYGVSCRKDKNTGAYCDQQFLDWRIDGTTQNCSDCFLGVESMELSSPFGYDDGLGSIFQNLTSSCGATGYAFSSPTNIAINGTATATSPQSVSATPTQSCTSTYTIADGDDCNAVATAHNVSTGNLMVVNDLNIHCENFPSSGTSLCIPAQCNIHTVQNEDSCLGLIGTLSGVGFAQLLSWNPGIDSVCGNLGDLVGSPICTSPPGGSYNPEVSSDPAVSVPTTATAVPTNARDGSNRDCGKWYTVQEGDDCSLVTTENYISLSDFYFLNPTIDANCTNLLLGIAYCVQAVGSISTYTSYPSTSQWITLPPQTTRTFTTPASSSLPPYTGTLSVETQLPQASGTVQNCAVYKNYNDADLAGTGFHSKDLNSCPHVAYSNQLELSDLLTWNPSLSSNVSVCGLQPGFSYCVQLGNGTLTPPDDTNPQCEQTSAVVSGTVKSCVCYGTYHGYDNQTLTCDALADNYGITLNNITTWNPWIGSGDCSQGLFVNLTYYDERALCIGVNATVPTNTASAPPSASLTTSSGSPGPTQSGIVAGCTSYYTVQSGDSCAAIEAQYAITFEQFYAWNPAIGSNCQSLFVGYAYCVAGPVTSTTSTVATTTGAAPAPTQSGISSTCNNFYTVQSGDSCQKIETQYSITFQQLYSWNPAIGDDCQSLWVGYAVCVGVSS